VVTWNVGEVYWPWQGNQLKDRDVPLVVDALREINADVVLLQELLHHGQLGRIAAGLRGYAGALPLRCGYDRHVAVLVRDTLAPRFFEHPLSPTSRAVVEAHFAMGGHAVRALALHFDVFNPERRLAQARTAIRLIGEPGALTVAGGDFNYDPVASARLGRRCDTEAEAALAERLVDVAPRVGPTLVGLLRVDRLFAGGAALCGADARATAHRLPLGDHAPVVCDLSLVDGTSPAP
jgi:endonuclease/exonuclease/phosphatase family metal-dependent hydrolase